MPKHKFATDSYVAMVEGVCVARASKTGAWTIVNKARAEGKKAFVGVSSKLQVGEAWG